MGLLYHIVNFFNSKGFESIKHQYKKCQSLFFLHLIWCISILVGVVNFFNSKGFESIERHFESIERHYINVSPYFFCLQFGVFPFLWVEPRATSQKLGQMTKFQQFLVHFEQKAGILGLLHLNKIAVKMFQTILRNGNNKLI